MTEHSPSQEKISLWYALTSEEVVRRLKTHLERGLTAEEVARRRAIHGPNRLTEAKRTSLLRLVIEQLRSFVVILLIVAAVISAVLGDLVEAGAILAIVFLNALLGVVQESRAEESLAALKRLAAPESQVVRDGQRDSIPAADLVPGDIVFLEAGNFIPADLRLVEAVNLRVEEAALTGESLPIEKSAAVILEENPPLGDRRNTGFMGTLVSYGRGKGVVVNTGMNTELGMIATMLSQVDEETTPLQKRLDQLGKSLGYGALAVCALVFAIGALRNLGNTQAILDNFMIAVSLAIAAVPEGLPAVVTISLALGMREMVRRHALIRRLASVETLGSATVICSDKTGTLTQNQMVVTRLWVDGQFIEVTGSGYVPKGDFRVDGKPVDLEAYPAAQTALWAGALNNDAQLEVSGSTEGEATYRMVGDPTEGALLVAAAKAGAELPNLVAAYPRTGEIPFDSDRKRMLTLHAVRHPSNDDISPVYIQEGAAPQDDYAVAVKGAPDLILDLCDRYQAMNDRESLPLDEAARQRIMEANERMAADSLRVLGLAYRMLAEMPEKLEAPELERSLVFIGLVGMIDPPRAEAIPALERARKAGIRTVMITGDFANTARAIAETIGLLRPGHRVVSGGEITAMDDNALRSQVAEIDVYARVSPEHKMRIVDALRATGQVVAMTGDGVNDAPAIKLADIGIAMGITGTDVAKGAADMVLTDDNYASIVSAVEQGRVIYSNIRKFVYYLLSCNLAEITVIFLALLFGWPSPLTAIQLLWLNLVTDGAPALALGTEKGDPDIMQQPPRPPKESIINAYMRKGIVIQTIAIAAVTLAAYAIGRFTDSAHVEYAQTMAFVTLSCSELLRAFTARSEYFPALKIGLFGNRLMNLAVLSSLVMVLAVVYVPFLQVVFRTRPLGLMQWESILPLLIIPSLAAEATKLVFSPYRK
ncbi:MAG: cation-translocating P-type ATPase [Anaerolineaceae bacterium]|nr:cation-translocating P-type ATPase [Anaerolineaceae bacterium]